MIQLSIPIAQYILLVAAIVCRVGAAIAHFPAIGETSIPPMIKIVITLTISICVGLALPVQPYIPNTLLELALLLIAEILLGTAFGIALRIILSAMHTGGLIVATQTGLGTTMLLDPTQGSEDQPFSTLLTMTAVVVLLAFDLHLILIDGLAQSYGTFPLGAFYTHSQNLSILVTTAVSTAFNTGVKMAFAYIIVGSLVSITTGIAARLIPHVPMFILAIPGQIIAMLWFFLLSISGLMLWFIDYYQDTYQALWS